MWIYDAISEACSNSNLFELVQKFYSIFSGVFLSYELCRLCIRWCFCKILKHRCSIEIKTHQQTNTQILSKIEHKSTECLSNVLADTNLLLRLFSSHHLMFLSNFALKFQYNLNEAFNNLKQAFVLVYLSWVLVQCDITRVRRRRRSCLCFLFTFADYQIGWVLFEFVSFALVHFVLQSKCANCWNLKCATPFR